MLRPGERVDGFRIEATIAEGTSSVVYRATQLSLGRAVAIKLLRPGAGLDASAIERFRREGQTQAGLKHPAILPVLEAGQSDHGLYIVMPVVEGPTLAQLCSRGELPARRALELLAQIAEAIDFAHDDGLIHRDIKPQNVLVEDESAYLADFGLVRAISDETITRSGQVFGTVAYLAPELIRGERASEASDRYAFAATAFRCLAGTVPFGRPTTGAALYAHLQDDAPRISAVRPALPPGLDRVFERALAKEPERRPDSCRRLIEEVREEIGEGLLERLGSPESRDPEAGLPPAVSQPRGRRFSRGALALAGTAAAVVALVAITGGGEDVAPAPDLILSGVAIGSDLQGAGVGSVDCDGAEPSGASRPCTILQEKLPGSRLRVTRGGTVVGWHVRGANGELRLQALRRVGGGYREVNGTHPTRIAGSGLASFGSNMQVQEGDRIGLELGAGAAIGARDAAGATTLRWFDALGFDLRPQPPSRPAGTGFDRELMLLIDFVPGREPSQETQFVRGEPAAGSGGRRVDSIPLRAVLDSIELKLGGVTHEVRVRRWPTEGALALELIRGTTRVAVMEIPTVAHRTRVDVLTVTEEPGGPHLHFRGRDPRTGGRYYHRFEVSPRGFKVLN